MNRAPTNNEVIICDEVVFLRTVLFLEIYTEGLTVVDQLEHKYSLLIYANILFLKINKFFKRYIYIYTLL